MSKNTTVQFAIDEYMKYAKKSGNAELLSIRIDTLENLEINEPAALNDIENDFIYIDVVNGKGIISGNNERSVLIAVYRFFTELGCRFLRPGESGEIIPVINLKTATVHLSESASYRHRGICIEGADSNQNILDMIDWIPKVGMNAYFIQFREAYTFYDRWYSHINSSVKKAEPFTIENARDYVKQAEKEIDKRSLLYHAVGHSWTCEPFGIEGTGWETQTYSLTDEQRINFAMINGVRDIHDGIALNANLCYSNPNTRKIVVNDVVNYLNMHKRVDILHIWLSDGSNNQCECDECQKMIPSDYYVMLLNEIDEALTANNIDTKLVFLIYVDLLWAPKVHTLHNKDRFILMFAPITRTYSKGFASDGEKIELPPYVRNKLAFSANVSENLAHLREWQAIFDGDSFDFDYHLWADQYKDPGGTDTARILYEDIKNLKNIGLNGFISCQAQRTFTPTGFSCYIMAKTLWDRNCNYEEIKADYFANAFGKDSVACDSYLSGMTKLFSPEYQRGELQADDVPAQYLQLCKIPDFIQDFLPTIESNCKLDNQVQALSWKYLKVYSEVELRLAVAMKFLALGEKEQAKKEWEATKLYASEHEDEIQPVFDLMLFVLALDPRF